MSWAQATTTCALTGIVAHVGSCRSVRGLWGDRGMGSGTSGTCYATHAQTAARSPQRTPHECLDFLSPLTALPTHTTNHRLVTPARTHDGQAMKPSERIAAAKALPELEVGRCWRRSWPWRGLAWRQRGGWAWLV